MQYESISVAPLSPYIGAEISGVDITRPLEEGVIEEFRDALKELPPVGGDTAFAGKRILSPSGTTAAHNILQYGIIFRRGAQGFACRSKVNRSSAVAS